MLQVVNKSAQEPVIHQCLPTVAKTVRVVTDRHRPATLIIVVRNLIST